MPSRHHTPHDDRGILLVDLSGRCEAIVESGRGAVSDALSAELARRQLERDVVVAAQRWREAVLAAGQLGTIEAWRAARTNESDLFAAIDELIAFSDQDED